MQHRGRQRRAQSAGRQHRQHEWQHRQHRGSAAERGSRRSKAAEVAKNQTKHRRGSSAGGSRKQSGKKKVGVFQSVLQCYISC